MLRLGISSWTFPWSVNIHTSQASKKQMSIFDLLKKARNLKVEVLQLADNISIKNLSSKDLFKLRHLSDDYNVSIELGTKGLNYRTLKNYLNICSILNSNILRTLILPVGNKKLNLDEIIIYINRILPELKERNIFLAIENYELYKLEEYAEIVQIINDRHVGICLDTTNNLGNLETPEQALNILGPYTINLHFKDFSFKRVDNKMGFYVYGQTAGNGMLNAANIFKKIISYGKCNSVILEQWPMFVKDIDKTIKNEQKSANVGVRYLKNVLANI